MSDLVIKLTGSVPEPTCALCGGPAAAGGGPQMCLEENQEAVCLTCAREQAPPLAALLELAHVAQHIGKISRHAPWVPLTKLLDLARAAERYTNNAA